MPRGRAAADRQLTAEVAIARKLLLHLAKANPASGQILNSIGRKVLVYLEADNKLNLAPRPTCGAELDAVWDLDRQKFEKADLHREEIGFRKPDEYGTARQSLVIRFNYVVNCFD